MIPDKSPMKRDYLEAKVTALLLGELPPDEAALLRELIARDAGLAKLHARLKPTLALLRETIATAEVAPAPPMKLSPERREKLLAQFKTVTPKEFAPSPKNKIFWLFPLAAVASFILLASLTLPSLSRAKQKAQRTFGVGVGNSLADKEQMLPQEREKMAPATSTPAPLAEAQTENQPVRLGDARRARKPNPVLPTTASSEANQIVLPVQQAETALYEASAAPVPEGSRDFGYHADVNNSNQSSNTPAAATALASATPPPAAEPGIAADNQPKQLWRGLPQSLLGGDRNVGQATNEVLIEQNFGFNQAVEGKKATLEEKMKTDAKADLQPSENTIVLPAPSPTPSTSTVPAKYALSSDVNGALEKLGRREQAKAAKPQPADSNEYSLNAVGHINVQLYPGYNIQSAPLIATPASNGAIGLQGGTAPSLQASSVQSITIDRPGNGQVASSNFYVDKETGQVSIIGHSQSSQYVSQVISNPSVSFRAEGGIVLDDVKKDAAALNDKTPMAASQKIEVADKIDAVLPRPTLPPPVPQPEVLTSTNVFSTFSLNVSDASFKLAAASLQNGVLPEAASIRSEEFINAFDYRDAEPAAGAPIGFAWERAGYPFAHNRDLLRFSVKTAAQGRQEGRPLNLVLLLDKSGSMERADRVEIIQQALRVLASQLHAQDTLSVVVFARTARLWVDGVPGSQAGDVANGLSRLTPEGGTNLEEAMRLAYETALRHYQAKGDNRVVLLTDGAANLGDVKPETLQQKVEANRKQGIALDCFGVGWDGYNDTMMETLSRAGHGRYGFINTPEEAATEFAGKLAGALRVAASDVKVQVEFNPKRVTAYRQIGYAKHQLAKEQFRDNTVAAAQIGAAESGNALYTVEVNPAGDGPLCTVRVRFRLPGTTDYQEHAWDVPYTGSAVTLDQATPAMRLAATASAFSEWLAASPYAGEVTPDQLLADLRGVPEIYGADALPKKLEWMIRQAKSIAGK